MKDQLYDLSTASEVDFPDLAELLALRDEAARYLLGHRWCASVKNLRLAQGFSELALFLAEIEPRDIPDHQVWVIVGDTPPLYFDLESAPTADDALSSYAVLLFEWVDDEGPIEERMPLVSSGSFEPIVFTEEIREMLRGRATVIAKWVSEGALRITSDDA